MKPTSYLRYTNGGKLMNGKLHSYWYLRRRTRYIKELHHNLISNGYENVWAKDLGIKIKKFTPISLRDVPSHYQELISVVCEYFSCRAIWIKTFPKNTIDPIQTFIVVGHVPDVYICSKMLYFEINNTQMIHFNRTKYLRRKLYNDRRRGVKVNRTNVRTITSKYVRKLLYNLGRAWERLLEDRELGEIHEGKIEAIYDFIRKEKLADFGKREYKYKPNIERAFCRENRFMPKKIIVYKKVTPFVY